MTSPSDYRVFGLRVRSSIPLPELVPAVGAGLADVTIALGKIAHVKDAESGITPVDGALVLSVPEVGRYRIDSGRHITIDPEPNVPDRNVRLFLLGSAFGALLHQRGLLPLHANAVEIGGTAVAFMGRSGAGKSTLAAWFHDHGYPVLADDVCVVGFDESGRAVAFRGLQRLRLWRNALDFTGRAPEEFERSYMAAEHEQFDKFDVPIAAGGSGNESTPVGAICLLDRGEDFSLARLEGLAAAEAIFENTYRGSFISAAQAQQAHWEAAIRLVQATSVFRFRRAWDLARMDELTGMLLAELERESAARRS